MLEIKRHLVDSFQSLVVDRIVNREVYFFFLILALPGLQQNSRRNTTQRVGMESQYLKSRQRSHVVRQNALDYVG